jgi:hypothetical protein
MKTEDRILSQIFWAREKSKEVHQTAICIRLMTLVKALFLKFEKSWAQAAKVQTQIESEKLKMTQRQYPL